MLIVQAQSQDQRQAKNLCRIECKTSGKPCNLDRYGNQCHSFICTICYFQADVETALDAGYRLFDTAQEYGSEGAIGAAPKKEALRVFTTGS